MSQPWEGETPVALRAPSVSHSHGNPAARGDLTDEGGPNWTIKVGQIWLSKPLQSVLDKTNGHLIIVQDGARYHTSKAMQAFFEKNKQRLTVISLPSYSPDYNPIEKLWKEIKKEGTRLRYFPSNSRRKEGSQFTHWQRGEKMTFMVM